MGNEKITTSFGSKIFLESTYGMSKNEERANQNLLPENVAKTHFPEGLRVLAVDDNIVCLKLLAALLQKCRYQVTTTTKATEALEMLRKNKENYDIVITDVKMLDMDGFELLEIIGLEMDIPVLMMSANDDTESVMKGVIHGARDYLLKPVRIEELKNIWQHVIRKSLFDPSKSNITKGETDPNTMHWKRQREESIEKEDETNTQSDGESCAQKKQRIAWTSELHKKFVAAVQRLEVDKAVPKKILELMNEPHLTRENVASHLQKYRNMLRKEKNKTSTSEDSNTNVNLNRTHGHVPDTTTVPSNNQGLHAINRVGDHLGNNAEMMSFRDHHLPKTETFGTPLVNQRPLFLPLSPQEMLLHQNLLHPNIEDQIRPAMPIPMLRNVSPAPILVANPRPHPGYNGTKLHAVHSWRKVVDDYVEISSHVPSFGATGQLGPSALPLVGFAPYSSSPGAFNFAGTPLQMRREAPISQPNSLVEPIPSSLPGQNDRGRNLVTSSGRGALDFRELTCRFQIDNRSPFVDDSTGNGQIRSVQPPPETSERENNGHHNSCSSSDDDLSIMVKEFGNNSAPEL